MDCVFSFMGNVNFGWKIFSLCNMWSCLWNTLSFWWKRLTVDGKRCRLFVLCNMWSFWWNMLAFWWKVFTCWWGMANIGGFLFVYAYVKLLMVYVRFRMERVYFLIEHVYLVGENTDVYWKVLIVWWKRMIFHGSVLWLELWPLEVLATIFCSFVPSSSTAAAWSLWTFCHPVVGTA